MLRYLFVVILFSPWAMGSEFSFQQSEFEREPSSVPHKENQYPDKTIATGKDFKQPLSGGPLFLTEVFEGVSPCPHPSVDIQSIDVEELQAEYQKVKEVDCKDHDGIVRYLLTTGYSESDPPPKSCHVRATFACGYKDQK